MNDWIKDLYDHRLNEFNQSLISALRYRDAILRRPGVDPDQILHADKTSKWLDHISETFFVSAILFQHVCDNPNLYDTELAKDAYIEVNRMSNFLESALDMFLAAKENPNLTEFQEADLHDATSFMTSLLDSIDAYHFNKNKRYELVMNRLFKMSSGNLTTNFDFIFVTALAAQSMMSSNLQSDVRVLRSHLKENPIGRLIGRLRGLDKGAIDVLTMSDATTAQNQQEWDQTFSALMWELLHDTSVAGKELMTNEFRESILDSLSKNDHDFDIDVFPYGTCYPRNGRLVNGIGARQVTGVSSADLKQLPTAGAMFTNLSMISRN